MARPNQRSMLETLAESLKIPEQTCAAYAALRQGVDYTQNPIAHGGFHDGSIPPELWTHARDLAVAFERLIQAHARFEESREIPF